MSGIKRKIEDNDPDYEDISQVHENKRNKVLEQNGNHFAFSFWLIVIIEFGTLIVQKAN